MKTPKSILITGCSSGIGLCAAKQLQQRGYQVFATVRNLEDQERLTNRGVESFLMDLRDSDSIKETVANVTQQSGGTLDALFNNAAYGQPGAVEDLSREVLREQFETNLFGTHELTNLVIPIMREQGHGRIIQNSSVLGLITLPYRGAYNASKFALEGLTDTLRLELKSTNIQVSLIEPGPITSKFRETAFKKYQENINKEKSYHRETYEGMEQRLTKVGPAASFTLPPEAVIKKLLHALESPRPKARYYVTFPTYLFGTLRRVLSTALLDRVLSTVSRNENR